MASAANTRTFTATILRRQGMSMTVIPIPFDPKQVFGKVRAPVRVTIHHHTYRSTIFTMNGQPFIPLRREHRESAGVAEGQRVRVRIQLDAAPRNVALPADLRSALKDAGLLDAFKALSFTHRREHVEAIVEARAPETRARRIAKCLAQTTTPRAQTRGPSP